MDKGDLRQFTLETSERVASMLHALMKVHQEIDGGFMTAILEIANDMAFQVQQAVELLSDDTAVGGANA